MLCGGRLDLGKGVKSHHCITHHITSGSQFWEVPVQNPDPTSDTSHRRNSSLHSIVSLHCFTASLHNLPQIYSSGSWCECYNKIYSLSSRKPCLILMIYNEIKILNRTYLSSVIYLYIYIYIYTYFWLEACAAAAIIHIYIYILYRTMIIYNLCDCYFRLALIHIEARNRCLGTHRRPGVVPRILTVVGVGNIGHTMNLSSKVKLCGACHVQKYHGKNMKIYGR